MTTQIVRSASNGKYHAAHLNTSMLFCNYSGQRRIPRVYAAKRKDVEIAGEHMFCRKCFAGKPDASRFFAD